MEKFVLDYAVDDPSEMYICFYFGYSFRVLVVERVVFVLFLF